MQRKSDLHKQAEDIPASEPEPIYEKPDLKAAAASYQAEIDKIQRDLPSGNPMGIVLIIGALAALGVGIVLFRKIKGPSAVSSPAASKKSASETKAPAPTYIMPTRIGGGLF